MEFPGVFSTHTLFSSEPGSNDKAVLRRVLHGLMRDLRLLAGTQKIKEQRIKGGLRGWTFYVRLRSAAADKLSRGRPSRPGFPGSARWIEKLSGSRHRAAPQHRIELSYDTNGPLETCYGKLLASNY
jgi:hypothetical protein